MGSLGGWAPGVVVKRCVLAAVGLTSRPWVQSPVEAGKGGWIGGALGGEGAATEPAKGRQTGKWLTSMPP